MIKAELPALRAIHALFFLFLITIPVAGYSDNFSSKAAPELPAAALVNELKKGGYVIYFRHGITGKQGEKHVRLKVIENCSIQRNLSEEGVRQAREMGESIKKLHIPIGRVFSSPYCRCKDTAINLFGRFEINNNLFFAMNTSRDERAKITRQLKKLLAEKPQEGVNTILVSHSSNLREATGIWPKPEGVAHVFKPMGEQGFVHVGAVLPAQWMQAAEQ